MYTYILNTYLSYIILNSNSIEVKLGIFEYKLASINIAKIFLAFLLNFT